MRFMKTNTATRVTVGPFLDKTDGITPEVSLTVTSEKLTLVVDTGGVPTLILDAAPTASGGNNDMVHITGDDAGFYDLELAAADVNYVGRAMLALTDVATHCPVFHEFMILPANVYDSLVGGSDNLEVDILQLGGVAQSATDLKDFVDTGYDPTAHKVAGVVLADTVTTYTGNTPQTGDVYAIVNNGTYGNSAIRTRGDAAWITATGFSTHSAADIWAVATRALTDKSGFSLTQAFPANFAALSITVGGLVDINLAQTLSELTGYPTTVGGSLYFIRQYAKNKLVYDKATDNMVLYEDNGTSVKGTHAMTDDASTATRGAAS